MNKHNLMLLVFLVAMFSVIPITLLGIKYLGIDMYVNILLGLGVLASVFGVFAAIYAIYVVRKNIR